MSGWYSSFEGYRRNELRHALKRAEPSIFERVLQFLEDDPRAFGAGYAKTNMWRYIRRYNLGEDDIRRLERAALNYLERPMTPEFKRMCQTMSYLGSVLFWQEVETRLDSQNAVTQVNAYCLYQYSKGLVSGERKRLELKAIKREIIIRMWEQRRPGGGPYFYAKYVLEAVTNPSVWKENQVVYREPDPDDLPIIRRGGYDELATLDFSQCDPSKVISALNNIPINIRHVEIHPVAYIFYVFGELGSNEAIPVIEDFYALHLSYRFENAAKWYLTEAAHRALQRIGTPEALQASTRYQNPGSLSDTHMRSFITGWLVNDRGRKT